MSATADPSTATRAFVGHEPAGHLEPSASQLSLHLQGMWVAFTVAAILTAYFVVRLSSALEAREAAMAAIRQRVARQERLASVTTLAAGAAHELGSPLATIAVASRELERRIEALPADAAAPLRDDARLIRAEVERCRSILGRLAADSGQAPGETPVEVELPALVVDLVAGLAESQRGRLVVEAVGPEARLTIPRNAFLQVARSLLQNAFDAGPGPVRLGLEAIEGRLRLRIEDEGVGMSKDQLARAGEPFFSTKPPGQGLGLGLFIARSLSEQMGGSSASAPPPARARSRSSRSGRCGRLREPRLPSDQVEGRSLFIVEDDDALRYRLGRAFRAARARGPGSQ